MPSSPAPVPRISAHPARAAISVLIVDDEPHVRSYVAMLLKSIGVGQTWQARDGQEALALYQTHRPVAVLLDVNMPHLGGEQTLRAIRAIDEQAAVVMVTSQNDLKVVKRFNELGAIGYVLKFAPKEVVAAAIAEALDGLLDCEVAS